MVEVQHFGGSIKRFPHVVEEDVHNLQQELHGLFLAILGGQQIYVINQLSALALGARGGDETASAACRVSRTWMAAAAPAQAVAGRVLCPAPYPAKETRRCPGVPAPVPAGEGRAPTGTTGAPPRHPGKSTPCNANSVRGQKHPKPQLPFSCTASPRRPRRDPFHFPTLLVQFQQPQSASLLFY